MVLIVILIVIAVIAVVGALLVVISSTPLSKEKAAAAIEKTTNKQLGKNHVSNVLIAVDSGKYDFRQTFTAGNLDGKPITAEQPFHVASVGKVFTATLIGCLIDAGSITLDDKIAELLDSKLLDRLYEIEGKNYSNEVTVRQLLSHTSGVADYFEDAAHGIDSMKELVLRQKDRRWAPSELVRFTADYQKPIAKPGETFHYSDTGYILLGLIIESISGKPFDVMLSEKIFEPMDMRDSYLVFCSEPMNDKVEFADIWLSGVNVKDYTSLSMDWSGGGVISTAADLIKFTRALNNGEIISADTLAELYKFDQKFMRGIYYGNGFMEYHFVEFSPMLKSFPNYVGHMGILGTQMFYDKTTDTVYISSLGSSDASAASVRAMINVINTLRRIK